MTELATNILYYGDNLDIRRRYLPDASVELIWHWGPSAEDTYRYLTNTAHHQGRVPSNRTDTK